MLSVYRRNKDFIGKKEQMVHREAAMQNFYFVIINTHFYKAKVGGNVTTDVSKTFRLREKKVSV